MENREIAEKDMERERLIGRTREYIAQKRISQAKMAGLVGIKDSTFSRWLNNDYPNPENIDVKVLEFLEKEKDREKMTETDVSDFVKTQITTSIWGLLDYIRKRRAISMVYGDSGVGKTKAVVEWAKDKSDVMVLVARPTLNTPKEIMKTLAEELKTKTTGTQGDIARGVIKKLKGTDKMIIIDEAQLLTIKAIDELRSLNDDPETRTAVVLVGNHPLYEKINKEEDEELVLLKNRMAVPLEITSKQITEEDIKKIFITEDEEVLDILYKVSKTKEGIRGAVEMYKNTAHLIGGKTVNKKELLAFVKNKKIKI